MKWPQNLIYHHAKHTKSGVKYYYTLKTRYFITFIRFPGPFGGHFEFDLYRSPEVTPIFYAMDLENTTHT